MKAINMLDTKTGRKTYDTFVIDPISDIWESLQAQRQVYKDSVRKFAKKSKAGDEAALDSFNQRDWGDIKKIYKRLMLRLKNLQQNIILIAREREVSKMLPDGSIEKTGEFTYESEKNTKSAVDFVVRLAFDPKKNVRYMTFDKDRSGHYDLSTRIDNPTFSVFEEVVQGLSGGIAYTGQSSKEDNVFVKASDRPELPEELVTKARDIALSLGADVESFVEEIFNTYMIPSDDGNDIPLTTESLSDNLIPRLEKLQAANEEEDE